MMQPSTRALPSSSPLCPCPQVLLHRAGTPHTTDVAFPELMFSAIALSSRTAASSTRVNMRHGDTVYIKSTQRNFDINVSFHKNNVVQWFSSLCSVICCITINFSSYSEHWVFTKPTSWTEIDDGHSLAGISTSFSDELPCRNPNKAIQNLDWKLLWVVLFSLPSLIL